jgi:tRNA A37 methylthiotransferase MiaB
LLIAGYPTETDEDYEFSKQWFRDRKHFSKNTVYLVQLTSTAILPGTQLDRTMSKEEFYHPDAQARRKKQFNELAQVIEECGFEGSLFSG